MYPLPSLIRKVLSTIQTASEFNHTSHISSKKLLDSVCPTPPHRNGFGSWSPDKITIIEHLVHVNKSSTGLANTEVLLTAVGSIYVQSMG